MTDLGKRPTIGELDLADLDTDEWSHRFVIVVDEPVENSVLLMYGSDIAHLLNLPPRRTPYLPLARQLPKQLSEVFLNGCKKCLIEGEPVRLDGETKRHDGRQTQYRAVFIPVGESEGSLKSVAFGAFNARAAESIPH